MCDVCRACVCAPVCVCLSVRVCVCVLCAPCVCECVCYIHVKCILVMTQGYLRASIIIILIHKFVSNNALRLSAGTTSDSL